jgi:hypothetical protein
MPNKWITFVREWSNRNNMSYGCALSKPECSAEYRRKNPKKPTKKQQRTRENEEKEMMGMEDFDVPEPIKIKKSKTKSKIKKKLVLIEEPEEPKQKLKKKKEKLVLIEEPEKKTKSKLPNKTKGKNSFIERPLMPDITNLNDNEKKALNEYFEWWDNNPYFKEPKKSNLSITKNHYYGLINHKLIQTHIKNKLRGTSRDLYEKFKHPDDIKKSKDERTKGYIFLHKDIPILHYDRPEEEIKKIQENYKTSRTYQPYRTIIN